MRRILKTLPIALLPLALATAAHSHEHEHDHGHDHTHAHEEHGSLGAHVHGVAELNVALDGQTLEIELKSPAMNLVGFEHAAKSAEDKKKVSAARKLLEKPQVLFGLSQGQCTLTEQGLESPLFEEKGEHGTHNHHAEHADAHKHEHEHEHEHEHSEILAHYQLSCQTPDNLKQLDLSDFFKRFPATEKIQVQLIGPNGQKGQELSAAQAILDL